MDPISLDAVNPDISTIHVRLPGDTLPSLASALGSTTFQPENSSMDHASFTS
jgi:hypothetical protein